MSDSLKNKYGRVGVLYGGTSAEREISIMSGLGVISALQDKGVDVVPVEINDHALKAIETANIDVAFIALHGAGGEDGTMQALLTYLGIPFTGSDMQASSLAMDKLKTKFVLQGYELPTPNSEILTTDTNWQKVLDNLSGAAMVKPAHEGSSIGMSKVSNAGQLEKAYKNAYQYDQSVFAEQLIIGREYTVAVLGERCLPAIQLETDNEFYDFEAKYQSDDTRYLCPCGLAEPDEQRLAELALSSFNALGCKGWGRVDFMADEKGNFYILEVNTVPGMTSHSLVPMAANSAGLDYGELCLNILDLAVG